MSSTKSTDVLEQNVSTLLESGGEAPRISDLGRARIRAELLAKLGAQPVAKSRLRTPVIAVGIGLVATAAAALIITRFVGESSLTGANHLADGSSFITEPGAKVVVLGPRRVRVEGAALLDVTPGKGMFVVETARGRIEVLGTRFFVDAEAQRTTAAVVRGKVKLATDQGDVVLHAGEQAVAEPGRPPVRGPAPRLSHLVSWAQQARRRDEREIEPVRHGTLFARDPGVRPNGQFGEEYPLPIKQLTLDVVVENQVARVALDQTFHNPHDRTLEGVYRFAIPPDAALQRLAMYVDGKLTESAVVERMQGRRIYEELVYRRVDPALLEYAGTGRLNLRVYPLPALQDKRLMVAYTQSLPKLYRDWTLAIPMPEVDQPVGEVVMSARLKGCANCEVTSPSHPIVVERSGEDAVVRYRRTGDRIGDAFVVHVRDARQEASVATKTEGSDQYVMVRAPVELGNTPREYRPRTWVILDDVSASRSALELKAQADLVDAFLREVDEEDKIAIVAFDVEARGKLAPTRVMDVDRRAVRQALKTEGGVGATDFAKALAAATKLLAGTNPDDAMIVYLGDGVITSGARTLDTLRAELAGKAHFIGVGVGDGPDTQTLDGLAAATGGYATTIDLADDLGWRAFDLIAALHTSRVTELAVRLVDASGALVPATAYLRSAQAADGEELELVAKLAGSGVPTALELTGTRDGKPWRQRVSLANSHASGADYLPRLWAQRHIAARLLAKHDPVIVPPCTATLATRTEPAVTCPTEAQLREQRDEAIRQDIVTLGKQYFLLSRHTSLLVLENDAMYAKYGVRKGGGDTWAPYAMPATIKVADVPTVQVLPADVADDAELFRTPLQIFYDPGYGQSYRDGVSAQLEQQLDIGGSFGLNGLGGGGGGWASTGKDENKTRAVLGLTSTTTALPADDKTEEAAGDFDRPASTESLKEYKPSKSANFKGKGAGPSPVMAKRASISTAEITNGMLDLRSRRIDRWHANPGGYREYGVAALQPQRYTYPTDTAFDDLTALVPALTPDAADQWREELKAAAGLAAAFPIEAAAKQRLAAAREHLATGVYRWDNLELAVDGARHFGWRRTTDSGLDETASFDGATFSRRYAEFGLTVSRAVGEDDVALGLAYLPILIADPAHYARWFVVKARGAREVTLSTKQQGTDRLAFVFGFDADSRLVSITDAAGTKLLEVTWGKLGPTAARVNGHAVAVSFSAETIADAAQWAHRGAQPSVLVELPAHLEGYWRALADKAQPGTPAWRHVERQLLVSAAALGDRNQSYTAYDNLRTHGGVELGDLVLASAGIATATTDADVGPALAPLAKEPLAHYLQAGRAYGKGPNTSKMLPQTKTGALGALWSLRSITAELAANDGKDALAGLLAMGDRAFALRLIAAAAIGQHWNVKGDDIARAWDSVATGEYKNIARYQAVQGLFSRTNYEAAADRLGKLVAELDFDAVPSRMDIAQQTFNYSRRGPAGWQILYAQWRDRVMAGGNYAHVMAFVPFSAQHPADLPAALARALALATDATQKLEVAQTAIRYGQGAYAQTIIEPLLKASPTRELYQLASSFAVQRGNLAESLAYLEKAQDAGADEAVDVNTMRGELRQIISTAQQLAQQSTGAERARAVERAMAWGARWRMIDPGNTEIDQLLGGLLLNLGDYAGAWRQMSSMIERDPWSSAGYVAVATTFENEGKVAEALELWQQAIVIDQTNPTPRLRKAQALIALGRTTEGDALLEQIANQKWHAMWGSVVYQAQDLVKRGKQPSP